MNKRKKRILFWSVLAALAAALVIWIAWGNTALEVNTYRVTSEKLPEAFDGFRIAHISDLHNAQIGKDNETLLDMLRASKPDMIAFTGDTIDCKRTDMEVARRFLQQAMEIAPCYFIKGNHENTVKDFTRLKLPMEEMGVVILEDARTQISKDGASITLLGLTDPSYQKTDLWGDAATMTAIVLSGLYKQEDGFTVLLSHRPEIFSTYVKTGVDLVLTGHAHGGQFRLPWVGGLYAPNQGVFPEYDAGLYIDGNTHMVVSRGIGNSLFPFRLNNRPELILIELHTQAE